MKWFAQERHSQTEFKKASIDIFRWFVVGGEGLPPDKLFRDDLLCGAWECDDDGEKLDKIDGRDSREPDLKRKD